MRNLTNQDQERMWWAMGMPHVADAFELADLYECASEWQSEAREVLAMHDVDTVGALGLALTDAQGTRDSFKEALLTIAALRPEFAEIVQKFTATPELYDFDTLCDGLEGNTGQG